MNLVLKTIDEMGAERWDRFVENHHHGSLYHSSAWHRVIEKAYGYSPRYLVGGDQDDIRAGLPLATVKNLFLGERIVSYPFSDYCDPLAETDEERRQLIDHFFSLARERNLKSAEVRLYHLARSQKSGISNFVLDLEPGEEKLFDGFHKSCVQRAIRKAEREGVEVISGTSLQELEAFYQLHLATRRKLGVPSQPFSFFEHLKREMEKIGAFELLLARQQDQIIAAQILLHHKSTTYYRFGASDPEALRVSPNHLLLWRAIQGACRARRSFFDFGRTSRQEEGLATFKRRWDAVALPLSYQTFDSSASGIEAASGATLAGLASSTIRHLPLPLMRLSGAFYRYLG